MTPFEPERSATLHVYETSMIAAEFGVVWAPEPNHPDPTEEADRKDAVKILLTMKLSFTSMGVSQVPPLQSFCSVMHVAIVVSVRDLRAVSVVYSPTESKSPPCLTDILTLLYPSGKTKACEFNSFGFIKSNTGDSMVLVPPSSVQSDDWPTKTAASARLPARSTNSTTNEAGHGMISFE